MSLLTCSSVALASHLLRRRALRRPCNSGCACFIVAASRCQSIASLPRSHLISRPGPASQHRRRPTDGLHRPHSGPGVTSFSLGRMRFFSASDLARRESRSKWQDAAQATADVSIAGGSQKPAQMHSFVVNGTEILLSTSPAVPGHSIIQFKGKLFRPKCVSGKGHTSMPIRPSDGIY